MTPAGHVTSHVSFARFPVNFKGFDLAFILNTLFLFFFFTDAHMSWAGPIVSKTLKNRRGNVVYLSGVWKSTVLEPILTVR